MKIDKLTPDELIDRFALLSDQQYSLVLDDDIKK